MNRRRATKAVIVSADDLDWLTFMMLAQQEGWRVPESEINLHVATDMSQAWALRDCGATIGLVTTLQHRHSAWIGNLIISPQNRGQGYGVALFEHVVNELRREGAATLWLTASAAGAPLYAARGFRKVGQIERWVRKAGGDGRKILCDTTADVAAIDSAVWGDDRRNLLCHLESNGKWLQQGESLALLQSGDDLQIIGPWYGSSDLRDDATLLSRVIAAARPGQELVVDLLAGSGRQELLTAAGLLPVGGTDLMAAGPTEVDWSRLLALATLGSCG